MGSNTMRRAPLALALTITAALALTTGATATPVARNDAEHDLYGRVFPEPIRTWDYINHGTVPGGPSEIADAFRYLEQRHPGYLDFTTVDKELGDPNAISVGPDEKAPWDPADTKDGLPFYVAKVTDESVPDKDKAYVLILNAHPAEACGQEGMPRFLEDLLIWRQSDPKHKLDAGSGLYDKPQEMTVEDVLKKVKIYFISTSPDGWAAGEGPAAGATNYNYAGFNENRVAYQDGWVFPAVKALFDRGYSALTQPEGAATSRYLRQVRERELGGRPFAVANDQHGPLPSSGALIFHDQGNDPAKVDRLNDYARRLEQNMDEVFAKYFTGAGLDVSQQAAREAGDIRDFLLKQYTTITGEPFSEKAAFLTLEWAESGTAWEHIDYTVTGTWGGWAGSNAGLAADAISFETACLAASSSYDPALFQLFVDNVRAASETGVVYAAQRAGKNTPDPVATYDLGGTVGFVETGARVTDRDGNPSPPPAGHPGTPLYRQVQQTPYDVANTDYFRDLRRIVKSRIKEVPAAKPARAIDNVASLVVADTTAVADVPALKKFAQDGGNLVLTDASLGLLPGLIPGIGKDAVRRNQAYVGYSDLDRTHPWTEGLFKRARQTFDPVGLGYPLLMERDQYWPCDGITGVCEESPTVNSAPIWSVDRAAWEKAGGKTIGTADAPEDPKFGGEPTSATRTTIGTVELGKGRIVLFGALLPQPSEQFDHWFGLNAYTMSIPGQTMLLRALRWGQAGPADDATGKLRKTCKSRRQFIVRLPRKVRGARVVRGKVTVGGRRVKVQKVRGRLVALVQLKGKRKTVVRVKITSITKSGRRVTQVRRFRTCVKRA
jgi:hypothetical protein